MRKCKHAHCRNAAAFDRSECWKHSKIRYRERNPIKSAFSKLRESARARGIEFSLTFSEFTEFAVATDYVTKTGNEARSVTVDRIDNTLGYVAGNIQALSREENARKMCLFDEVRMKKGLSWRGFQ